MDRHVQLLIHSNDEESYFVDIHLDVASSAEVYVQRLQGRFVNYQSNVDVLGESIQFWVTAAETILNAIYIKPK